MSQLNSNGKYTVSDDIKNKIQENFIGFYADENETAETIKKYFDDHSYLVDTHTAVALCCAEKYISENCDDKKMIVASTASPYKFAADVYRSITGTNAADGTGALADLSRATGTEISLPLRDLDKKEIKFTKVIDKTEMLNEVYKFI